MDMKIYTLTHKKFNVPPDPLYVPLQVGREGKADLGYLCDNTGENISALNCYYSELTGLYWIWKNDHETECVGTCHYHRYVIRGGPMTGIKNGWTQEMTDQSVAEYEQTLKDIKNGLLVSKSVDGDTECMITFNSDWFRRTGD